MIEIKKKTWADVTVKDFNEIRQIQKIDNEAELAIELVSLFTGEDRNNILIMPYEDFNGLLTQATELLTTPINTNKKVTKKMTLNGNKYIFNESQYSFTTAQYIDLQQVIKKPDNIVDILSIIIIPEGQKYGEYDIDEAKYDIENYLDIETAKTILNFWLACTNKSLKRILLYLQYTINKMSKQEKDAEVKARLVQAKKEMEQLVSTYGSLC